MKFKGYPTSYLHLIIYTNIAIFIKNKLNQLKYLYFLTFVPQFLFYFSYFYF